MTNKLEPGFKFFTNVHRTIPLSTRLRLLFVKSEYAYDYRGGKISWVRIKRLNDRCYILESGKVTVSDE